MQIRMQIRTAEKHDLEALRNIYLMSRRQAFHWLKESELKPEDFDRDTDGESIRVAADAAGPVGFVSIWTPKNFIHNLFVHPRSTGRGIGTALLNAGLEEIGRPATLKCLEQNEAARKFYESRGWRVLSDGDGPDGKYHLMQFSDSTPPDDG